MEFAKKQTNAALTLLKGELTALDNLLTATPVDPDAITQQYQVVDAEIENYFKVQTTYMELLVTNNKDADFDAEQKDRLGIRKKRITVMSAINKACGATSTTAAGGATTSTSGSALVDLNSYRVRLPQRELPKFGGDVRQWRSFWASFQELEDDKTITEIGRYNYLVQSMVPGSAAAKVVSSFPPAATSYQLAKAELEHRFGRKKTLIKVFVRDLLSLVIENAKDKKSNFVDVVTNLQSQILNLEELGVTQDKYGELLYPIIESCIPVDVLNRYLDTHGAKEEMADIMDFLRHEVRRQEESARAQSAFTGKDNEKKAKCKESSEYQPTPTATSFMAASTKQKCGFCGNNHITSECRKAITMTNEDRKEALKKSNTCFKCLKCGHNSRKCNAKILCIKCKRNHHTLMCFGNDAPPAPRVDQLNLNPAVDSNSAFRHNEGYSYYPPSNWAPGSGPTSAPQASGEPRSRMDMSNYIQKAEVLLQTQLVNIYSSNGSKVIRVMHDPGSQSSYIRKCLAMELGLKSEGVEKVVHQTFGAVLSKEVEHPVCRVEVSGVHEPYKQHITFQTSIVDRIAENIIAVPKGPWLTECNQFGIPLTDTVGENSNVDILIGNDISPYLKVGMRSTRLPSGIIATETILGWFLEGKIPGTEKRDSSKAMVCVNMQITDTDIANYWALETIGINDAADKKTKAELEEAAMEHFRSTVKRDDTGRYVVHLPFIEGHPSLPDNRQLCYRRLENTTKNLLRDGRLEQYNDIFREWESNQIIERVPNNSQPTGIVHYLGHHAVYKEGSTTPVRPVFNGSGRSRNHPSLNDCVVKGVNFLEIIPTVLSLFRLEKIGVIADIRKAFLQLKVTEEHRDCLRFLWWEDIRERKQIAEYRHCRVVFGVSSSPFLLGAAIQDLLTQNEALIPETVSLLRRCFYVDNCVASLPTMEAVLKFKKEAEDMFLSAQMDLRGWEYGPTSDGKQVPVLGLQWNTGTDMLSFDIAKLSKRLELPATKRSILIMANSIFDPLGLLCPFIISIKILFKEVCLDQAKYTWDAVLPETMQREMDSWKRQISLIPELKIPRHIAAGSSSKEDWSLHVMCDACKDAYTCCVYLRIEGSPVRVQLIQARARVTPAKVVTIPRAELLACLIGSRLYTQVVEDLGIPDVAVTFWSGSMTALTWIKNTESVWGVFVNRRVAEIRRLTSTHDWRHVPGEMNFADQPSRGISLAKYMEFRWWEGPAWLYGPPSTFPNAPPDVDENAVCQEKKKNVISCIAVMPTSCCLDQLDRLGDWEKIVRSLAYWVRFVNNKFILKIKHATRTLKPDSPTTEEIRKAENILFRYVQKSIRLPPGLKPQVDDHGILRLVTRLVDTADDTNFTSPIILPGNHPLIRLLIRKEHSLSSHGGVQYMLSILRQKYWIVNARRSVKAVISRCSICRVHMAKRCKVVEAPLPLSRVTTTHCFDVTGVDLAGPLILRNGEKVWIVLFTCAVYRAVHLELVSSLSTEAFLQALRKFVARRGRPATIYSDNGTNFRGCDNLFQAVDWTKVKQYASVKRITWIFNPPTAAWWGGWWERLVGLMKQLLRRVLGSRSVYYPELEVLLMEAESVLNDRPLTYISEDPADLRPLTPSLFLRDLPVGVLPEADVGEGELRRNLKHVQRLREELRTRFRKEYLSQLISNGKVKRSDILNIGDVVLVEVDNRKRIEWPMGVVVEVYSGRDGKCRTAKIRTTQGEIIRPFQRLFPVEMKGSMPIPERQHDQHGGSEESCTQDDILEDEDEHLVEAAKEDTPEPIVVTKHGRIVKKPIRLGIN